MLMQEGVRKLGQKARTAVLITVLLCLFIPPVQVDAAQLSPRSLYIADGREGAATSHKFGFNYVTSGTAIGVLEFLYCDSPIETVPCVAPVGIDASGATLASQSGENGFSIASTSSNSIVLIRAASIPNTAQASTYSFNNVVNPSTANRSFYARIHTYTNIGDPSYVDFGSIVNSTIAKVLLQGEVPPILKFCVGVNIVGDCDSADGNLVDLGVLDPTYAGVGTSQMQVATNAEFGVAIAMYGTTMTSGNQTLPALTVPTASAPGNSQFGINLRQNSSPQVGEEPRGTGVVFPAAGYDVSNRFKYVSGDVVAIGSVPTEPQTLTVSYLANTSPSQMPGVYNATMTFVCTGLF